MSSLEPSPSGRLFHRELWLLLAITALGAFLRFCRLATLPPGDGYDVAQYGVDALRILAGARPVFFETNFGREALFSYLVAAVYLVTGPGTLGIRIACALVGTLTIPANFLVAREMIPDRPNALRALPLLVALLTAVSFWHIMWSRMGLRVILVPLVASLLFTFLWRGLRRGSWLDFALAGLLLGIGFYTYQIARLLPVLVALAFLLVALSRRAWTRRDTAALLLVAGAALLVYLPLGIYARAHPGALSVRLNQVTLWDPNLGLGPQLADIARQSLNALAMFGIRGDTDPLVNIPGRPSLDPFLFAFLLVGIGLTLWRWRKPTALFLLGWLAVMTAPAMLADQAATAKRALGALPPTMILIALGMLAPLVCLRAKDGRHTLARLYTVALAVGLALSAWLAARDYFVVWASDPDLPMHFQADFAAIGRGIGQRPAAERVYLSHHPPDQPVIQLHSGLRADVRGYNGQFCLLYPDPSAPPTAATWFTVPGLPDRSEGWLEEMYPTATTADGPLRPHTDQPFYRTLTVPAGAAPQTEPATATAYVWEEGLELLGTTLARTAVLPGETLEVELYYRATAAARPDYTAFVHMLGEGDAASGGPLLAQSDSPPCQGAVPTSHWLPGDILRDAVSLTIPAAAPPGRYALVTGFYSWPDLVRLPLRGSGQTAIPLATIEVLPAP